MYRGEVDVAETHLTEFLRTAAGLKVRGLTETDKHGLQEPETRTKRKLVQSPPPEAEKRTRPESRTRLGGYPIPSQHDDEIVLDAEPPTTSAVKEERDEPSTTWTPAPAAPLAANSVVRSGSVSASGQEADTEDYPLEMTSYQSDLAAYDEDRDPGYTKVGDKFGDTEAMMGGDRLNKAYQCEMCNMSFNQKWLLRYLSVNNDDE